MRLPGQTARKRKRPLPLAEAKTRKTTDRFPQEQAAAKTEIIFFRAVSDSSEGARNLGDLESVFSLSSQCRSHKNRPLDLRCFFPPNVRESWGPWRRVLRS